MHTFSKKIIATVLFISMSVSSVMQATGNLYKVPVLDAETSYWDGYSKGHNAGYKCGKSLYKNDVFMGAFIGAYFSFFLGLILLGVVERKLLKEQSDVKAVLKIFKSLDAELHEVKKFCTNEISLEHSTLRKYQGNADVAKLSHLEKAGFYKALGVNKQVEVQVLYLLETIKLIVNNKTGDLSMYKHGLYTQVKAAYSIIYQTILYEKSELNEQLAGLVTLDDEMTAFLLQA